MRWKDMEWSLRPALLLALALGNGCLAVKSQHEVKPIHITMDVHFKVDRELDRYFGDPQGEVTP